MKPSVAIARAVQAVWAENGVISTMLLPLSWLTRIVTDRRRRRARQSTHRAGAAAPPVIVVGNLYVGGTGKTPVVIALAQALQRRGRHPGVVSRGYGARIGPTPRVGTADTVTADRFGDEPALIARAAGCPVAVHPRRTLARDALLQQHPQVDVILSDDGLQHWQLERSLEIIVQDARGTGNGRLLPAGPLREPVSRMADVDFIISNLLSNQQAPALPVAATRARRINMRLQAAFVRRLQDGQAISWLDWLRQHGHMKLSAAAAIGRPERFFAMLRSQGAQLFDTLALPDHHDYVESPFGSLRGDAVLITAKDGVKCGKFHDPRLWVVEAEPVFSDPDWTDEVVRRLEQMRQRTQHVVRDDRTPLN
ncbi:MAG: tetraacyldisaccharide 4'-kinase [Candidimonas sp.]